MKLLIMQSPAASHHFLPHRSKHSLQRTHYSLFYILCYMHFISCSTFSSLIHYNEAVFCIQLPLSLHHCRYTYHIYLTVRQTRMTSYPFTVENYNPFCMNCVPYLGLHKCILKGPRVFNSLYDATFHILKKTNISFNLTLFHCNEKQKSKQLLLHNFHTCFTLLFTGYSFPNIHIFSQQMYFLYYSPNKMLHKCMIKTSCPEEWSKLRSEVSIAMMA
jgi:hypothetical protein